MVWIPRCPLVLLQETMYILPVEAKGDLPDVRITPRFATGYALSAYPQNVDLGSTAWMGDL